MNQNESHTSFTGTLSPALPLHEISIKILILMLLFIDITVDNLPDLTTTSAADAS